MGIVRFHRSISVSELYKLKDTVDIQDEVGAGRMVSLSSAIRNSPVNQDPNDEEVMVLLIQRMGLPLQFVIQLTKHMKGTHWKCWVL